MSATQSGSVPGLRLDGVDNDCNFHATADGTQRGRVGVDIPPPWAVPIVESVKFIREEFERADFPSWRKALDSMLSRVEAGRKARAAAMVDEMKDDIEAMKEQIKDLPTESDLSDSETFKEELKPVEMGIDSVQMALDDVREGVIAAAPGQFERTIAYTNELYISSKKSSNKLKVHPVDLQQVPALDGTLPWNTRVRGADGEEIVLPPLVSLDAVEALAVSQLAAYVQVYYPGREVPEDLAERKRLVLRAIGRSNEAYEIV